MVLWFQSPFIQDPLRQLIPDMANSNIRKGFWFAQAPLFG